MATEKTSSFPYLNTIGWNPIVSHMKHAASVDPKMFWVSVGSGTGEIEHRLKNEIKELKIACIDPADPDEWKHLHLKFPKNGKCIKPSYKYTEDLIREKKFLVGKCGLLLCWPSPKGIGEKNWDIEAIKLLEPRVIVLIYETSGGSGGPNLNLWIRSMHPDVDNLKSPLTKMIDSMVKKEEKMSPEYVPKHIYSLHSYFGVKAVRYGDEMRDEICILTRSDVKLEKNESLKIGVEDRTTGKETTVTNDPQAMKLFQTIALLEMMKAKLKA
jgi:hypothetical protein